MKLRLGLLIGVVILAGVAGVLSFRHIGQSKPVTKQNANPSQAQPTDLPPPDRLTIAAIKARSYPGSAITVTQNLGEQGGYSAQIVSYQSDGLTINGLLATPDGAAPAGGWPAIIFNHGYIPPTQYSTTQSYKTWVAALAKGGFVVFKPDYRGNAQSQGQPEGGHFSPVYAYDVLNALASVRQYHGVNPDRVGMFGHSLGGHETLRALVVSKHIKASVIAAGVDGSFYDIFYNWPNSPAPRDQPTALVQGLREQLIAKYGEPKSNPEFWNSASALNYVGTVTGPVQVEQGKADTTVPQLFSDHIVQALQQAGKPVDYKIYNGADHNFAPVTNQMLSNAVNFFKDNL